VREYGLSGDNLMNLRSGCTLVDRRACYASPPRIVYFGSLSSQFINLRLLSALSQLAEIDVYGAPPTPVALGLNYRGWAPPDVLADYQFGLITCTDDPLRRAGFSAKHLEYFSYGLPVLVPRWRDDPDLAAGSVPYDESSFAVVIEQASGPAAWQALSDAAFAQAQRYTWDNGLAPIEELLQRLRPA
jgi:hypothetical protein